MRGLRVKPEVKLKAGLRGSPRVKPEVKLVAGLRVKPELSWRLQKISNHYLCPKTKLLRRQASVLKKSGGYNSRSYNYCHFTLTLRLAIKFTGLRFCAFYSSFASARFKSLDISRGCALILFSRKYHLVPSCVVVTLQCKSSGTRVPDDLREEGELALLALFYTICEGIRRRIFACSLEDLPAQADEADSQAGAADAQAGEADSQVGNESATITQEGETDSGQSRFIRQRGGLQSAQLRGWGCPILGFCVYRKLRGQ